ncbi:SGNH/GDSL hydrolase family protein [Clostridium perfringens]|uniref:SGNH/GDSL hydrolase family protein n=1 Tax=Clostridium perfringens TaxID=1502 RepID=UPI0028E0F339|nr:SGNH/GDSL hydrolase family protein [Clostridium perfringens]EGT5617895.1 SGNH/GDSL hydrolase family protein [Clostridium perfringens]MDT9337095.1 SGNH/GDSL hydrolase family protein [Clostridium perfringens]MDT9344783.1 SGNH/GDSL hydrolase family protein [Clostridium perfringens]MDT9348094.1 SGNH/GDSL hydrolase family protein [Clostridium perfringens]MDT9353938.1 SGNH/GDSL hydrolase family protein [Clostridium perfringens]
MIRGDKGSSIVFTGDSITHGPLHTKGYRSYTEHFRERLKEKFKNENIMVFNTGVSGATTRDVIRDFNICVNIYDPDIVFIMLGMNDSLNEIVPLEEYRSNILELINKVREIGAIPIIQTSNIIKMDLSRKNLKFYMDIVREVARENNVMLIDHYSHWEELEKENSNLKNELLNDLIHPNENGHLEMAKFIFKELDIFDEESYTCNLSYPIKAENDLERKVDNKCNKEIFNTISNKNPSQEELIKYTKENLNDNLEAITNLINEDENGIWVFLGDGDTNGTGDTFGYKNYVEYVEERIRWELNDGSINKREKFMINFGTEDTNSGYLMNNFEHLVSKYNPKVVFIMIGGNEKITPEEFKHNLVNVVIKVKNINSIPILQSPIKNGSDIEEYVKVIREVSEKEKIFLIDHYEYWDRLSKVKKWVIESWLVEGKANHRGHLAIAKKIFKDLRIYDYNSLICGFTIEKS